MLNGVVEDTAIVDIRDQVAVRQIAEISVPRRGSYSGTLITRHRWSHKINFSVLAQI